MGRRRGKPFPNLGPKFAPRTRTQTRTYEHFREDIERERGECRGGGRLEEQGEVMFSREVERVLGRERGKWGELTGKLCLGDWSWRMANWKE